MKPRWPAVIVLTCGLSLGAGPATAPSAREAATPVVAPRPTTRPSPFGNRLIRLRDLAVTGSEWQPFRNQDQPVTPELWQEVTDFGQANFPNRWKLFEGLQKNRGDDDPLIKNLRSRFVGRYRLLKTIETSMPDLYDAALKQSRLEDDAWAAVIAYRKKREDPKLNDAMRQKVSTLVKNLLDERQERLKTLQQSLADEQKALETDRDNVDDLVDRQIARLSGDDPGLERFGRDGRGEGFRGDGMGGFGRGGFGRREFGPAGRQPPPPATQP